MKTRTAFVVAAAVAAVCLLPCRLKGGGHPSSGEVVSVYDGDTITIEAGGETFKCRLLGIDAPEMNYGQLWSQMEKVSKYAPLSARRELAPARRIFKKWADVAEANARTAQGALSALVLGKTVRLEYDRGDLRRDQYGRLLVYVDVDGTDVSAELLSRGLAVADTRFSCVRLEEYVTVWRSAQAGGRGMWRTTGRASAAIAPVRSPVSSPAPPERRPQEFWASRGSDKFHYPSCSSAKRILPRNRIVFGSAPEAVDAGYSPCGRCRPPRR